LPCDLLSSTLNIWITKFYSNVKISRHLFL
jgi:hypothetical protein